VLTFLRTCCATTSTLSNTLKQREKCVKAATALLEEGTSVVIGKFIRNPNQSASLTNAVRQHKCRSRNTSRVGDVSGAEAERAHTLRTLYLAAKAVRAQRHLPRLESWPRCKCPNTVSLRYFFMSLSYSATFPKKEVAYAGADRRTPITTRRNPTLTPSPRRTAN
jgi:hypothetical protein